MLIASRPLNLGQILQNAKDKAPPHCDLLTGYSLSRKYFNIMENSNVNSNEK